MIYDGNEREKAARAAIKHFIAASVIHSEGTVQIFYYLQIQWEADNF